MGHVLHILKDTSPVEALAVLEAQAKVRESGSAPPRLLLIQEAVRLRPTGLGAAVKIYVLKEDVERFRETGRQPPAGAAAGQLIGYREMLDLIFQADTITVW